jgi:hypothetical protein
MTDPDRRPEVCRTTVIDTGDRDGGGYGGAVALILLLVIVGGIAWFLMRGGGTREAAKVGVNVSLPKTSDINIKVPDKIEIKTDKGASNAAR